MGLSVRGIPKKAEIAFQYSSVLLVGKSRTFSVVTIPVASLYLLTRYAPEHERVLKLPAVACEEVIRSCTSVNILYLICSLLSARLAPCKVCSGLRLPHRLPCSTEHTSHA